jgi:hypothetical protein
MKLKMDTGDERRRRVTSCMKMNISLKMQESKDCIGGG